MSKRNIAYIKPKDPSFLAQLKQQIGYKEGPSVETKRQKLEDLEGDSCDSGEDCPEREDEKPQVVVLKTGDLTAEEAALESERLAKEVAETPADLNIPIIFRKRHKAHKESEAAVTVTPSSSSTSKSDKNIKKDKSKKNSKANNTAKLSFDADNDGEEEE